MITASIVTYHHSSQELEEVLNSLLSAPICKLFLIDNSKNDLLRKLEKDSNKIHYIHNENIGYGGGHNIAIREALMLGTEYHIVVNPDVYFNGGVIEYLSAYMEKNKDVGLVMPQILYPNGETQYLCKLLPTPMDLIGRRFCPFEKYVKKMNERYELRFTGYDKIMTVPFLSGCFMFLRADALNKVQGFDERYFMYAEDLDLSRRIGEFYKTVFNPTVFIYHSYEKGSYKNGKLLRYHILSIIKYFNKWGWFFDKKRRTINKTITSNFFH